MILVVLSDHARRILGAISSMTGVENINRPLGIPDPVANISHCRSNDFKQAHFSTIRCYLSL
jgi:hypothetical protein